MLLVHYIYHSFDEVGSTQDYLKIELKNGKAQHGEVVSTMYQSAGYGRQQRTWHGKFGNIALSIVVDPEADSSILPQLTYVAGVSVLQTILFFAPDVNIKLKWVNDILINDCKVAGILCEMFANQYAIIGIGVNLESNKNIEGVGGKSLAEFGIKVNRDEFIKVLLEHFKSYYNKWCTYGFNPIRIAWSKYSHKHGDELSIKLPGEKIINGKFESITEEGKLILNVGGKLHTFAAGNI